MSLFLLKLLTKPTQRKISYVSVRFGYVKAGFGYAKLYFTNILYQLPPVTNFVYC